MKQKPNGINLSPLLAPPLQVPDEPPHTPVVVVPLAPVVPALPADLGGQGWGMLTAK